MSAPQIPNLNTLRRGGGGGRRPGRGSPALGPPGRVTTAQSWQTDKVIQQTDNDAAVARWSATTAGYYQDDFARIMNPNSSTQGRRMSPQYNRGTFVRTYAIDRLVDQFILDHATAYEANQAPDAHPRVQIISLGAGSDTRYFRIKQKQQKFLSATPGKSFTLAEEQYAQVAILYHEIDFPENTRSKIQNIRSLESRDLLLTECGFDNAIPPENDPENYNHPLGYHIHALDLRKIPDPSEDKEGHDSQDKSSHLHLTRTIDSQMPTLLISECCLMYLPPSDSERALKYFVNMFPSGTPTGVLIYEPFRPSDAYGRMMVDNLLKGKNIQLQNIEKFATLAAQRDRLTSLGFCDSKEAKGGVAAADMWFIWDKWVSKEEKDRINRLELFDEVEELVMLFQHYCVVWGWRDGKDAVGNFFKSWAGLPADTAEH
ncbi:MAG: hypothetical protein Q9227_005607 [Pyrenula ochraceoflavens]